MVVSTQLDFSVKNESFDDMKYADYLFFNMQDFTYYILSLDFINSIVVFSSVPSRLPCSYTLFKI